jgi:hypothetical protein
MRRTWRGSEHSLKRGNASGNKPPCFWLLLAGEGNPKPLDFRRLLALAVDRMSPCKQQVPGSSPGVSFTRAKPRNPPYAAAPPSDAPCDKVVHAGGLLVLRGAIDPRSLGRSRRCGFPAKLSVDNVKRMFLKLSDEFPTISSRQSRQG